MHLYDLELKWIQGLQKAIRTPLMDWIFIGWNFVDTLGFVLIAITVVWYLIDRKIGVKMFYILILSGILNKFFKGYFDLPRPCQLDPAVGILCPHSPGLPSGAAQTAMIYAGIIFIECKKKIYWLLGVIFALFLCFSRIYLGIHFFTDILGGLVIGGALVLLYWKLFPRLENYWKPLLIIFPFFILLLLPKIALPFFWISLSTGIGLIIYDKQMPKAMPKMGVRISQVLCALVGICGCLIGIALFPKYIIPFAVISGFWLSYLGAFFGRLLSDLFLLNEKG